MLSASQSDALVTLIEQAPSRDALTTCFDTVKKVVGNCSDPSKRVLKHENAALQKRIFALSGGEAVLVALGFVADAQAATLTWDENIDPTASRAAIEQAALMFEAIATAIIAVGDANAPAQAKECLKLCGTYVGNIVAAEPDVAASRRRIGAANKALNGRILSVAGGAPLFASCGFLAEPESGEPESFVCGLDIPMLRVVFASLEKAPSLWASVAASQSSASDANASGGGGSGGPKVTPDQPSVAVANIVIKSLPTREALDATRDDRDMQPALCKSDDGYHVQLHTFQCAARRWTLCGTMEIPGGDFRWAADGFGPAGGFIVLVDLGDAHGTGKPVEMRVPLEADGSVNEYTASRDFINAHEADSYAQHKEPLLNMNWLEEIARKVRAAASPILETARNLKAAMEAQH